MIGMVEFYYTLEGKRIRSVFDGCESIQSIRKRLKRMGATNITFIIREKTGGRQWTC